jgi:hypothetical protein
VSDDIFPVNSTADSLSSPTSPENFDLGTPRLSTIPEENASEVSILSDTALLSVFGEVNETNKRPLTQAILAIQQEPCVKEPKIDLEVCTDSRTFWTCELNETDELGYSCVQLYLDNIWHIRESIYFQIHQLVSFDFQNPQRLIQIKRERCYLIEEILIQV